MSNARNLSKVEVDTNGDIEVGSLGNANDASALTTGTLGTARLPAGSVIQVVSANDNNNTVTSSASFVNTALAVTITPTSSTSKIYVVATGGLDNNTAGNSGYATITRNGTNLGHVNDGFSTIRSTARSLTPWSASFLDSPATTSPLTYTVQIRASSGSIEFPGSSQTKTITVMEIAG